MGTKRNFDFNVCIKKDISVQIKKEVLTKRFLFYFPYSLFNFSFTDQDF